MAKIKTGEPVPEHVPDVREDYDQPAEDVPPRTARPVRVYLVQAADWNGGNTSLGVGDKDGWEMEPSGDGFLFRKRVRETLNGKKAFWVPRAGIRFVEFLED